MSSQPLPTLKEALKDQTAGPVPITIEEYRRRQKSKLEEPNQEQSSKRPKKRGGKQVKQRQEVGKLLAEMAVTEQERKIFLRQIKEIYYNKKAGPAPLIIEEFCKRLKSKHEKKKQERISKPGRRKKRGGKLVKQRQEVGKLRRLAAMAVTQQEKEIFLRQIEEIYNNQGGGRTEYKP